MSNQLLLDLSTPTNAFIIAGEGKASPILIHSSESEALFVAVNTFAEDVKRVTGVKPEVFTDSLLKGTKSAIVVSTFGTAGKKDGAQAFFSAGNELSGQWESYQMSVKSGDELGVERILAVTGSDKVSLLKDRANISAAPFTVYTLCLSIWASLLGIGGRMFR